MDEVLDAVIPELEAELRADMATPWTGRDLADRGIGILIFGRDHPIALEYLLSARDNRSALSRGSRMHGEFIEALKATEGVDGLEQPDFENILFKMETFTAGLLNAMRTGVARLSNEEIVAFTNDIGEALIVHAILKKKGTLPRQGHITPS